MQFEYPWNNDRKKLKFIIKGLQLARYLVTVLGSNIKTVTWMGDNINYTTRFQGGSRAYLSEDENELDGDYDVANSAVTIIDKLGPLDADAPYVIEFKKEPQNNDWANFMISCQGIGDDVQITDLDTNPIATPGTVIDSSDANLYTSTSSMDPALNDNTFPPIVPATDVLPCTATAGLTPDYSIDNDDSEVRVTFHDFYTTAAYTKFSAEKLPAGYYLVTGHVMGGGDASSTVASNFSHGILTHKALNTASTPVQLGSKWAYCTNVTVAVKVTSDISTNTELFRIDYTSSATVGLWQASAAVTPISQAFYDSLS